MHSNTHVETYEIISVIVIPLFSYIKFSIWLNGWSEYTIHFVNFTIQCSTYKSLLFICYYYYYYFLCLCPSLSNFISNFLFYFFFLFWLATQFWQSVYFHYNGFFLLLKPAQTRTKQTNFSKKTKKKKAHFFNSRTTENLPII